MESAGKTIGLWNYHEALNRDNFMMEHTNAPIGDDLLLPFVELGTYLNNRNVKAATLDALNAAQIDAYLFIDMPDKNNSHFGAALNSGKPLFLLILESPLVRPENYDPGNHSFFNKIFTYNDTLVDNDKYLKVNYAFSFPQTISFDALIKDKLFVMIAGNKKLKKIKNPNELYSERKNAVNWFERNHPETFDLYGFGWSKPPLKLSHLLNPFKAAKIICTPEYSTYKGPVVRKKAVLERYKFAICYENIRDVPGYITEKIFDCFFAGCVPVYWGANNIKDYIPGNCFIDKREFRDYESLYKFSVAMTEAEYGQYLDNIEVFLKSDAARQFSCANFVKVVAGELLASL